MFVPRLAPSSKRADYLDQTIATREDDGGAVTTLKGLLVATKNQVAVPERSGSQPLQRNTDTPN